MFGDFQVPQRTIMTPGPVETHPKVRQAMSNRTLGQFDPAFLKIMDEVKELIKVPFGTKNKQAFAVDGSSRSGLEAAIVSLVEPGDKVLVPAFGRFAYLLAEIAERAGGEVTIMEREWTGTFDQDEIIAKIEEVQPKLVALVHGETANGQLQAMDKIGAYCQENDVFLMADMVATYGGVDIQVDDWGVDIAVAGSQKCVSVPAGLSLVTYNQRVEDYLDGRYQKELGISTEEDPRNERRIQSNYLDLSQLQRYWSEERINHHTEATTQIYGIHAGLRQIVEVQGMEATVARHNLNDKAIVAGVQAMGLGIYGNLETKMPTVIPVLVPEGINEGEVKDFLLNVFGVEIASSFGPLKGKVLRIGNMGYSSRRENVLQVLGALEATFLHFGADINAGQAVQAALDVYLSAEENYQL